MFDNECLFLLHFWTIDQCISTPTTANGNFADNYILYDNMTPQIDLLGATGSIYSFYHASLNYKRPRIILTWLFRSKLRYNQNHCNLDVHKVYTNCFANAIKFNVICVMFFRHNLLINDNIYYMTTQKTKSFWN